MQTDTVFQDREPFDLMKTVFQFCWSKGSRVVVLLTQYNAPYGSKCDKAKVLFFLSFFFSWLQTRGAQHISGCGDGGIFLATQPSSVPDGSCPTHRNLTNNTKKKKRGKGWKTGRLASEWGKSHRPLLYSLPVLTGSLCTCICLFAPKGRRRRLRTH